MIARLFFQRRVMSSFVFTISCLTLAACGGKGGGPGPDQGTHDETIIQPEDEETDVSTAPEEEEEIVPKYFNLTSYGISSSYPSIITMAVGVTNRITGLPVTNLEITNERSDFQVLEDDKPITERESFLDLEPIESISNQLDTVLMIDVSSSLTRADLINVQKAAIGLVSNLAINQRVAIYVFDDTVRQVIDFSTDVSALTNAINNITLGGPSTNLFGAIMHGYSLWSNSFSFNQITYGALILLTDGNDTSGLATLSEAITAKGNRDFFAITVGNEINQDVLVQLVLGKEQTVTDADRNRAAGRLISAADYSKVDAALQQIAEEVTRLTKGVYFLYYATPTRAGMHTVSVSVKDNPPCEATELFCVDRLNGEFNADGFSSVTPELVVKRPDEWLQADQSYELKARVRWANPPFTLNWPFDSLDGQIKLDIDKVDKSKATLSVAKDTLLDLASLTVSVLEYPSLTRTFPFRVGVPIRDEEGILRPSNTILLSNARLSIELAAAIDCNECSWELSNPSVATLSTQTGQDIILQRGSTPGITNLIISEPTGARSTSYPIQTTFFTQVADQIYMTDVGITTLTISYGRFLENCEVSPELPPGLAINVVDNTCLITGTPSAARKATRYTITVTTTNDTQDTVSMMITVNVPQPPKLANATNQTYVATVPISPLNFVNTGEPAMSCTISPALPEGLILSSTIGTCQISGAPMAAQAEATYTITSIAADGSQDTATVTITVIEANPPIFTNVADLILEMDQAASLSFNNAGGAVVTCEISPSLPIGLIIASTGNTCQITGTPSVIKVGAAYTLTATATDGSQNAMTFNILFPRFWSIPQNTVGYSSIGSNQVNDVDVSGSNIYLATNGGLSISEDEGETWVTKTTSHGLGHNIVNGVYTSGSVLYAATLGGLSISYNGGASWATKNVNHGLGRNNVLGVYASESNIYAATQGGLSISSDGGMTWINKTTGHGLGSSYVFGVYVSESNIYAATQGGLSISSDGGMTWINKTTGHGLGSTHVSGVYVSGSNIYAATLGGLSISSDGGMTWINKTTDHGLGNNSVSGVYVSGSSVYAATSGGLSISSDGGVTWINKTTAHGLGNNSVSGVYVSESSIYAATSGGLSISSDGGVTWINKTTAHGLGNNSVSGVYVSESSIYAATSVGLSISSNGGMTWINKTTDHGLGNNSVLGVYVSGSNIYAATSGGLSISSDGGMTWINKTAVHGLGWTHVFGVYVSGSNVFAATSGGLSISSDGGVTWINKTKGHGLGSSYVRGVYVSESNIYAATQGGLSISSDGGMTWINKTTGHGLGSTHVSGVYVSGSNIYAATLGGLSISSDGGETWTNKTIVDGLGSNNIYGVYVSGANIYAATLGGLSISSDGGNSWNNETTSEGLASNHINGVHVSESSTYVATENGLSVSVPLVLVE